MRICFLCNQIAAWGKIGGFGMNLRRLGAGLARAGVEVHVITPRRRGQGRVEQLDGMTIHGISWSEIGWSSRVYREINADIYHTQEPNLSGVRARQDMPHRPHLVTCMDPRDASDWWQEWRHATWLRRLKLPGQWYYEDGPEVRSFVRNATSVYVETEYLIEKTQRHYHLAKPPAVLPKPVPIPQGPFVKPERPLCLFLGRLVPRKQPELFIQLARELPQYDFVMIGRAYDRGYQRSIEKLTAGIDNLRLTGFLDPLDDPAWSEYLSRAWVLVHPAVREGLATAFQEASVHEAAILAQVDPGGYTSRFGRVVPAGGKLDVWKESLRNLIESGEWRALGAAGREYNRVTHDLDLSVARHLDVYQEVLAKPASMSSTTAESCL